MKKNMKKFLSVLVVLTMLAGVLCAGAVTASAYAEDGVREREPIEDDAYHELLWNEKIDAKVWAAIDKVGDDDLVTVWLWLKGIDRETINTLMIEEKGMDPAAYEDTNRFYSEIVPLITNQPEGSPEYLEAVNAEIDEYIAAKREITSRLYTAMNKEFISKNIAEGRKILYCGSYTSTLIVEITKSEILAIAKNETVTGISLYEESYLTDDIIEHTMGDVDLDSEMTIADVTLLQKYLAHIETLDEEQVFLADFNEDDELDIADATAMQKSLAKIDEQSESVSFSAQYHNTLLTPLKS